MGEGEMRAGQLPGSPPARVRAGAGGYALPRSRRGGGREIKWRKRENREGRMQGLGGGSRMPDARLYTRLERLVGQLSKAPERSIPQACGSVHETKAAYRFLG